jgi:YfaZ precursor
VSARTLITLSLILLSTAASAQRLDINLKQDSARFSYITLIGGSTFGRTELNAGLLYNEDGNKVANIGLQVIDMAGSKTPGLELGVGPRFYYLKHNNADSSAAAIALGGQLRYKIPSVQRLSLIGKLFYAPSITTTLDADSMYELGMGASYELLPTANIYVHYRRIRADFTKGVGKENIDSGVVVGVNFTF